MKRFQQPFKAKASDRKANDILTELIKQIGGGAPMVQAAILDAQVRVDVFRAFVHSTSCEPHTNIDQ